MSAQRRSRKPLRIGLFGGTFDPIHNGHLAVARAARRRLGLDRIYFVPCGRPPHKDRPGLSPYLHRFTMVALACAGVAAFLPSLLEAGPDLSGRRRYYSIESVRRLRRRFGPRVRVHFLMGADSFLYLPEWKDFRRLICLCDFVVADRPGYPLDHAGQVLPADVAGRRVKGSALRLPHSTIYFLNGVQRNISATQIRRAVRRGRSLRGRVPPLVADYIETMGLYQEAR
ncbi:MAG: nicotinate-nucleotide adenylyltransferase [Terriglobia bacterium]